MKLIVFCSRFGLMKRACSEESEQQISSKKVARMEEEKEEKWVITFW